MLLVWTLVGESKESKEIGYGKQQAGTEHSRFVFEHRP
jgi:hypothetical protein